MSKVCILISNGFEEIEGLTVCDVLRRAEVECDLVSIGDREVIGAHNIKVISDKIIDDINDEYDAVVLPGGMPGSTNLRDDSRVMELVQKMNRDGKLVTAICAAPIALAKAGVLEGKNVTSYPGFEDELGNVNYLEDLVVVDSNIITSRGPATALEFSYEILKNLKMCKAEEDIREGMLYNLLKK